MGVVSMEKLRFSSPPVLISLGHIALIIGSTVIISYFVDPQGNIGKLMAGLFIGSFMMITKETLKHYASMFTRFRPPTFDPRRWVNICIHLGVLLVLAFMSLMSLLGWYASWEGATKVYFGLGFLLAGFATDYGLARVLAHEARITAKA
jgi:hypothetical protein